ncbi:ComF family protein [Bacillus suaedae]|uniref:ComF family protein n=1 Tax=Halalkalibacter suaedae TaxID=2822140 RepID=A0A940WP50_9BACI|nr:phosphoribosyltransferase family protein [Bacillus suaedae]MBP3950044.1 ComF family protein [Bacillus suaedae]
MSRCLVCHESFFEAPSWSKILLLKNPERICGQCEAKLSPLIRTDCCVLCSRSLIDVHEDYKKEDRCLDCLRWESRADTNGLLERNRSLYEYNSFLKEWLTTFKFRGDAAAAIFFSEKLASVYNQEFMGYLPVAIPLSEERLLTRGFNQSALMMEGWAVDHPILSRTSGEKQSKKNRKERLRQVNVNPFTLNADKLNLIKAEKILLIDDIYTTGTTIRQAARTLREAGVEKVASLTVAR